MRCEISSKPQTELIGSGFDTKKNRSSIVFTLGALLATFSARPANALPSGLDALPPAN